MGGSTTFSGTVAATTLTGSGNGSVTFSNAGNNFTNLGPMSSAGLTVVDTGGLTVNGTVVSTATTAITTTGSALTLNADVDATGQTLTLSGVGVTQSSGSIFAATATVTGGTGAVTLTSTTNDFTGAVHASNSGASPDSDHRCQLP